MPGSGVRPLARAIGLVVLSALWACSAAGGARDPAERGGPAATAGTIWSRARGAPVARADVEGRLRAARFALLGETHDNPGHHRIQAELVRAIASEGPPPTVVFEMLDPAKQEAIDAFRAEGGRDADAFAARVAWDASGWPDFAIYRPLLEAVLAADLKIVAAGLSRGAALAPDAPERTAGFGLDTPLPAAEEAARLDEMFVDHCELLPRESLGPMVEFQRARDARLALALLRAAGKDGRAVLVAGDGHVRDGDVPTMLARAGVARDAIVNVGLLEVGAEADREAGRFDFVFFTPEAERDDPCDALRRRLAAPSR
jgi:uncharacterized iron-regulated protein